MHLAAASLGLATRWVSAINMPPIEQEIRALLGIPEEFVTYDMMALGTSDFKPMPSIGRGVEEIRVWDDSGTYRVIYTARFRDAVYVLHAFHKKTQATPKKDIELARARFQQLVGDSKR